MTDENKSLGSLREIVIRQIKRRDNQRCRNCGLDENLVVDSVVPIGSGGNKKTENLVTLCKSCKSSKNGDKKRYNKNYPDNWGSFRKKVYKRDNYNCQNCGLSGGSEGDATLNAHHIVPRSFGGNDTISNCVTLCKDCHSACHSHMSSSLEPTTKREQSTINSEDSETGTQTATTNECLSCGSEIDWDGSTNSCKDCHSFGENSNSKAKYSEESDGSKYSSKHAKYRRREVNTQSKTDTQDTTERNISADKNDDSQQSEGIIKIIGVISKREPRTILNTTDGEYDIHIDSDTQINDNVDLDVGEVMTVKGIKKGELIHAHDLY